MKFFLVSMTLFLFGTHSKAFSPDLILRLIKKELISKKAVVSCTEHHVDYGMFKNQIQIPCSAVDWG